MMTAATSWPKDDAKRIRRALETEGGHLGIGRGGYVVLRIAAASRSITLAVRHSVGTTLSR
jgi:hypothetical protein